MMENKKSKNSPSQDIEPVSRPSNEEIDDDIADDMIENSTTVKKKFFKNDELGKGIED